MIANNLPTRIIVQNYSATSISRERLHVARSPRAMTQGHIHSIASLYCLHCAASGVIPTTRCICVYDEHNTPGWNEYVKDAHSEARDAFKLWILSSKPRHGDGFQSMKQSRARFKFKLRQCKRDEAKNTG